MHDAVLQITTEAGKYLVEQFVVQGLVAAVALPMTVMSAANLIDTWWAVCLDRAEKAGKLLAHVLMSGAHGDRYYNIITFGGGVAFVVTIQSFSSEALSSMVGKNGVLLHNPDAMAKLSSAQWGSFDIALYAFDAC